MILSQPRQHLLVPFINAAANCVPWQDGSKNPAREHSRAEFVYYSGLYCMGGTG
jgi:hypothetical protein